MDIVGHLIASVSAVVDVCTGAEALAGIVFSVAAGAGVDVETFCTGVDAGPVEVCETSGVASHTGAGINGIRHCGTSTDRTGSARCPITAAVHTACRAAADFLRST